VLVKEVNSNLEIQVKKQQAAIISTMTVITNNNQKSLLDLRLLQLALGVFATLYAHLTSLPPLSGALAVHQSSRFRSLQQSLSGSNRERTGDANEENHYLDLRVFVSGYHKRSSRFAIARHAPVNQS
jgi:hypothetical protein